MSRNLYDLIGLVAAVCFILALKGLSSPKSARRGNLIGALGATIATVIVFFYANGGQALNNQTLILVAINKAGNFPIWTPDNCVNSNWCSSKWWLGNH